MVIHLWLRPSLHYLSLGGRLLAFTSADAARRCLGSLDGLVGCEVQDVGLVAMPAPGVYEVLRSNFTLPEADLAALLVVDPSPAELGELIVWHHAMHGKERPQREGARAALAELVSEGRAALVVSPGELHRVLSLRRRDVADTHYDREADTALDVAVRLASLQRK